MSTNERPPVHTISTEHQKKGDARRPSDTLDRGGEGTPPADAFDPVADVGKAEPGGNAPDNDRR